VLIQKTKHTPAVVHQEWTLLRVWDAMEFEEEQEESTTSQLTASGDIDEKATRDIMHLNHLICS